MNNQERVSTLHIRLQEILDLKKMKAIDLSNATGISKGAISYYLSGKFTPSANKLYLICKALGISEAWLLGYDVPRDRTSQQVKNDGLARLISRMRHDEDFYQMILDLSELTDEKAQSIKQLLRVLRGK